MNEILAVKIEKGMEENKIIPALQEATQ